jgi:hypothetical protein
MPTTLVFCPTDKCEGHAMTDHELEIERRAMRPFSLTRTTTPSRVTDPDTCFRVRDAERAENRAGTVRRRER